MMFSTTAISLVLGLLTEATAPPVLDRDKLRAVRDTAEALLFVHTPTCDSVSSGEEPPPQNVEAAVVYEQIAAMYGLTALRQPRVDGEDPAIRTATIGDKIDIAIQARIDAARCLPGTRGVHHLDAALDLLRVWERQLAEEGLPEGTPAYLRVQQMISAVEAVRPPSSPTVSKKGDTDEKAAPAAQQGYARFVDRIHLRIEFGFAGGNVLLKKEDGNGEDSYGGFGLMLSTGMRLPVARHHVLLLGGYFAWSYAGKVFEFNKPRSINAGGLQLEWGIRTASGAFSVHPSVDFGAHSFYGGDTSGQLRFGGAIGLCMVDELICLNSRGFVLHPGDPNDKGDITGNLGYQFGLGFDLFRAIDRRWRKRHQGHGYSFSGHRIPG